MEQLLIGWYSFLDLAGESPFVAMWYVFINGGWIAITITFFWILTYYWLELRERVYAGSREWILLSISVPRVTEQTPRAVENIFAHLAGAHSPPTWKEKWIDGKIQDQISVEIISTEGRVSFLVYSVRKFRDLIEATIYAQYPDAEISEVEDYTQQLPVEFPDPEYDLVGTEMIRVKEDFYPIRTYHEFEDKISGELKDPMAVILESFSRLGPGEHAWYQIVITPIDQKDFRKAGEAFVKKLSGIKVEVKPGIVETIISYPFKLLVHLLQGLGLIPTPEAPKKQDNPFGNKMWTMTPGEKNVLESVEMKLSKIAYQCKIRFIYVAKKEVFKKARILNPFIGGIKQFNTNDMQALKPESKRVGVSSALWFFKGKRNDKRKTRLAKAYRSRSNWVGISAFHMNIEELASLWHFPISIQTKSPQLQKTEAKRSEAPYNLPFG
jgi:hypothetical protein